MFRTILLAASASASASPTILSVFSSPNTRDPKGLPVFRTELRKGGKGDAFLPGEAAWGTWTDSYNVTGWSTLEVHTNPDVDDATSAAAAGFFEGAASALRLEQSAFNMGVQTYNVSGSVSGYLAQNNKWMSDMVELSSSLPPGSPDKAIFYHVDLIAQQIEGIFQGYLSGRQQLEHSLSTVLASPLTKSQLMLLNLGGDLEDLGQYKASRPQKEEIVDEDEASPVLGRGRCSALIRLPTARDDIIISQETWSSLNSMLRVYKMYDFPFLVDGSQASGRVSGERVSFSSYPGVVASLDDFYVLSQGMVVQETTIGNSNPALYEEYLTPFSILEFARNVLANRLATSGATWGALYQKYNSGTYNNMNMVLDYKLFSPGQTPLADGTLTIVEQIPGTVVTTDVTYLLEKQGYFGSYNIAFAPLIRDLSGTSDSEKTQGPQFSYTETPRAQIFARDAPKTESLADVKKLMRSCDYTRDPLSSQMPSCKFLGMTNCTPAFTSENCIATRGDLNPADGVYGLAMFGHRNHIASDAKISSFLTYNSSTVPAHVICGPVGTSDNPHSTPSFKWSNSTFEKTVPHLGHPDLFDFNWQFISF